MTAAETLTAAGWKPLSDGKWRSPDTGHEWPERVALLLASVPRLTTASQLVRRTPRRHAKR